MPKINFDDGTVQWGVDFDKMTPEDVATELLKGVPADNLKHVAANLAPDAAAQAHLNSFVKSALILAQNQISQNGVGALGALIAAL